jgi:hypothetical protein
VSEQDVNDIWMPVFKEMAAVNGMLRVKKGETINPSSTLNKKAQYHKDSSVIRFKIDFRLICYHCSYFNTPVNARCDKEVDLAAGEIAINSDDQDKIIHDQSKGLREAKDIVDSHICHCFGDHSGWFVMLSGLCGTIATVNLDREGLYVAVNQYDLHFPRNISELSQFTNTLQAIHTLFVSYIFCFVTL